MKHDEPVQGRVILIFGSTGTAGAGAVQACLDAPEISEVRAVTRRPLGLSHDKLVEVSCTDFADLTAIAEQFRGVDLCLYCLGISARKVKGEDEYREIHVSYPLAAARALLEHSPGASFVYLSGSGTKRTSWMMWARVKAEAEDQLAALELARHVNVRPGGILPLQPTGASRWLMAPLLTIAPPLGIGAYDLGRAMLRVGLDAGAADSGATLENRDLRALVRE
jgi:uncharacterized protein YbjT (DUF2867 family)